MKNVPDYVPSLLDSITPWQWLILPSPKPFRIFHLARERKTRWIAIARSV